MRRAATAAIVGTILGIAGTAAAQPEPDLAVPPIEIHGFVSQGAFVSTDNDFLGRSSRGSLELFEAGLNLTSQLDDRLRVGLQLFSRNVGDFDEIAPRVDWAYLDYRVAPWLGVRLGVIKMPFGLYNEFADVDAARLPILMPGSVYPPRNRDTLLSHTGAALYGHAALGGAGEVDYQAWLGSLTIPRNALTLQGATLDEVDTHYVAGAQAFWTPATGRLRLGATYLRASIDFHITLTPENTQLLIDAGIVPPDFDGAIRISQRPTQLWIASAEWTPDDWTIAAEYSRWLTHQVATIPELGADLDSDEERFYALVAHRWLPALETGVYYAVTHLDADDRRGRDARWAEPWLAFQRDLAATIRWDVTPAWLWKLEGHLIDGAAELSPEREPDPVRRWGLFLLKTTVTF